MLGGTSLYDLAMAGIAMKVLTTFAFTVFAMAIAVDASRPVVAGDVRQELGVPSISFADLIADNSRFHASAARDVLREAMTTDGIVAVTDVPDFNKLRRAVMLDAARCGAEVRRCRLNTSISLTPPVQLLLNGWFAATVGSTTVVERLLNVSYNGGFNFLKASIVFLQILKSKHRVSSTS